MQVRLLFGDCVVRMATMSEGSIVAIVCDPPYGLEFMGKAWDKLDWQAGGGFSKPGIGARQTSWPSFNSHSPFGSANPSCATCGGRLRGAKKCVCTEPAWRIKGEVATGKTTMDAMKAQQEWHSAWLAEAYRILMPGGVIKAFGGTRTFHRMAMAMEEAGFVDIHLEAWAYGSGFPKSLDVSKAIDKQWGRLRPHSDEDGEMWTSDGFDKVRTLKVELRRLFDTSGKSRAQIDKECGFRASNYLSVQTHGKQFDPWFFVLPSPEKWQIMQQVLGLVATAEQAPIVAKLNELFQGAERTVLGYQKVHSGVAFSSNGPSVIPVTAPATDASRTWEGWGTALKPAWEPVVVGRKPVRWVKGGSA